MLGLFRHTSDDRRRELLSSYIDGELTDAEVREVEEYLESSEEARQELAGLQMAVTLLHELPALEPSRSFKLETLPEPQKAPWWSSLWVTGLATSMATMLLIALVAGDMLDVLVQTREAAVEGFERFGQDQSATDGVFALDSATKPAAAPALAAAPAPTPAEQGARPDSTTEGVQAASAPESDASQVLKSEPVPTAPAAESADVAPQAATSEQVESSAPAAAAAAAPIRPPAAEETTQPEPASDAQAAAPEARTLAARAPPAASVPEAPTPEPAPVAAAAEEQSATPQARTLAPPVPKSASVEQSLQSQSTDEPEAFTAAADIVQGEVKETPVVQVAEDEAPDTSAKAAEFAQQPAAPEVAATLAPILVEPSRSPTSVDTSKTVAAGVEPSTVDDQSVASVPSPGDVQAAAALERSGDRDTEGDLPSTEPVAPVPASDGVDLQNAGTVPLDRARESDSGVELPLRQLQVAAGVIVLLLTATTAVISRRRRSPAD